MSASWQFNWRGEAVISQVSGGIRDAVSAVGSETVAQAKGMAPVRTGALRDDISMEISGSGANITATIGTRNLRYGLIQEIRVGFLRRAGDSTFPSLASRIGGI